MTRPRRLRQRTHTLNTDAISKLDRAHSVICTEWETLTIALGPGRETVRQQINRIGEHLDEILDLIVKARGCTQAELDEPDDIKDIDAFLSEHTPPERRS